MNIRSAMRAVLLTPQGRILLMKLREPTSDFEFWITPGGAIEQGETVEAGLCRELAEETGLCDVDIGPLLWTRKHDFVWNGQAISQREAFYLVETLPFEPTMENNPAEGERSAFQEFRWWSAEDIRNASAVFAPRCLADLLEDLIKHGPPKQIIETGI